MTWYNRENNTFNTTVQVRNNDDDRRQLKGMLPDIHIGDPNWMWNQTPDTKTKCLQLPSRDDPRWGKDHGHPGHAVPIPVAYFGGIGLGYQCTDNEDLLLEFNDKEGKIQKKEWSSSIVFNDENLTHSLKNNGYHLFKSLRELVGGGIWIRFQEDYSSNLYKNRILVKSTYKQKYDTINQKLKLMRDSEMKDRPEHLKTIIEQDIIS
jgi:hypothetical protein